MTQAYFIAGTDTGVGKTTVACALLHAARKRGWSCAAVKPVASGSESTAAGLRNDDALRLQAACTLSLDYQQINPIALQPAIAPHFAARQADVSLEAEHLAAHCRGILDLKADLTLVEGAGGWRVPLNARQSFAEIPRLLGLAVILVVDVRLGCLNHALLSAEAIIADGVALAGWVANQASVQDTCHREMVEDLQGRLPAPLLGDLPHAPQAQAKALADRLSLSLLAG